MSFGSSISERKKNSVASAQSSKKRHTSNWNESPVIPRNAKVVRFNLMGNVCRFSKVTKINKESQNNKTTNVATSTEMKETVVAMQKLQLNDVASKTPSVIPKDAKASKAEIFGKAYRTKKDKILSLTEAKVLNVLKKDVAVEKEISTPHPIKEEIEVSKVRKYKLGNNYFKDNVLILSKGLKEDRVKILEVVSKTQPKDRFIRYSLPVHVGEWYDGLCRYDSIVEAIDDKFAQGLNFGQQKQEVLQYLQKPVILDDSGIYVMYNCAVQIMSYSILNERSGKLVLSTLVTEDQILQGRPFCIESASQVTLSEDLRPLRRNVFSFVNCDTMEKNNSISVNYHECVYIQLVSRGKNKPLYLRCEIPNTDYFGENNDRFLLRVTETLDSYCKFQIQSLNHLKRRWKVREPVQAFEKVLICHNMSNRLLAVDQHLINDSLVVGREIKACCFKYKLNYDFIPPETLWSVNSRKSLI